MPRPVLDKGLKPFEFRTGVGGLPPFGGMYRAGDPVTIPPHKFHLLVNMRVQPEGLLTRPGLETQFDTGVEECIDGITEANDAGSTLLLWPGALSPGSDRNAASFRVIFAGQSTTYSEFMFVLTDTPAAAVNVASPVLQPPYYQDAGNLDPWQEPFFFRGQLCAIQSVSSLAIVVINLPERYRVQANDCLRNTTPDAGSCTGQSQLGLWPYGVPIAATTLLTLIECPLTDWQPEAIVAFNERDDHPLTGEPGVHEMLYLLALGRNADAGKRRLLKFDGTTWSVEFTLPDGLLDNVALGGQTYGPYLVASGTADDWSAYRKDDGTWATIAGLGGPPIDPSWTLGNMLKRGITYDGVQGVVVSAVYTLSVTNFSAVHVLSQDTTDVNTNGLTVFKIEDGDPIHLWDWAQSSGLVYAIGDYRGNVTLFCSNDPDISTPLGDRNGDPIIWIQEVGGRVYVGGKFINYDPVAQAADGGVTRHGVYDVTDPTAIALIYEVKNSEQADDALADRYSLGCLPTFPESLEAD